MVTTANHMTYEAYPNNLLTAADLMFKVGDVVVDHSGQLLTTLGEIHITLLIGFRYLCPFLNSGSGYIAESDDGSHMTNLYSGSCVLAK